MIVISAGIDDLATERQISEGWSYFVIENELLDMFSCKSEKILKDIALDSFHGKLFKRRFKERYLDFLKLCREYSEKSEISLIAVILQNEMWKNQFIPFTERIIKNAYGKNNITDHEIVSSSQKLTGPLFSLQKLLQNLSSEYSLKIVIDSHTITKNFDELEIEVSNTIGSDTVTAKQLLIRIYNSYRNKCFPNSPTLINRGISVRPDENLFIIQAADIIGNFSLSYIMKKLGKESKTINMKSEIFAEVFGDKFESIDISKDLDISESGEIILKNDGQHVLMFGRYQD